MGEAHDSDDDDNDGGGGGGGGRGGRGARGRGVTRARGVPRGRGGASSRGSTAARPNRGRGRGAASAPADRPPPPPPPPPAAPPAALAGDDSDDCTWVRHFSIVFVVILKMSQTGAIRHPRLQLLLPVPLRLRDRPCPETHRRLLQTGQSRSATAASLLPNGR